MSDLSDFSMEELFRADAEVQCGSLSGDLLAFEQTADQAPLLERLMRAAHSLKGAARIVGCQPAVRVAHVMEELFVQAQKSQIALSATVIDLLLEGVDLLRHLAGLEPGTPDTAEIESFVRACQSPSPAPLRVKPIREPEAPAPETADRRDIRLDAERLDNLLGLAGQAVVASRPQTRESSALRGSLRQVQTLLADLGRAPEGEQKAALLRRATAALAHSQSLLAEETERRDGQTRRLAHLCHRIYQETLACRLRRFADILPGIRRLARDVARDLGKEVSVVISGENTEVDRDVLDRLDGPLSHLVRNALDHGIEFPADRQARGKAPTGRLSISAHHQAGWLVVTVADDGRGLDFSAIKAAILRRGLAAEESLNLLTEPELLDFLLLPGFSLSEKVTEISGRGVGLDAVRAMAYGAGGSLRLLSPPEGGFRCEIVLPVSLSLVRSLVVKIGGGFFALPLTRVERVLHPSAAEIHAVAGRQHVFYGQERIEVLRANEVLELPAASAEESHLPLIIVHGPQARLGLVVEEFVGLAELSLQRLDSHIGRVQDVSATALLESGEPVVVLDVNDLAISAANFSSGARYRPLFAETRAAGPVARRILVADDSLTVRELERKLLAGRGYAVETAVDGADAWNALRAASYDLLVTDIDMPRLDGIELVKMLRADPRLRDIPVIVVSYKDRPEDRARGLEAGADFYLPKSSYNDESLLDAVNELIGAPLVT